MLARDDDSERNSSYRFESSDECIRKRADIQDLAKKTKRVIAIKTKHHAGPDVAAPRLATDSFHPATARAIANHHVTASSTCGNATLGAVNALIVKTILRTKRPPQVWGCGHLKSKMLAMRMTIFETSAGYAIEGAKSRSNLKYINCASSPENANVQFFLIERKEGRVPLAKTKRPIHPAEELVAVYGIRDPIHLWTAEELPRPIDNDRFQFHDRNLNAGDDIMVMGDDSKIWHAKLSHDAYDKDQVGVWWYYRSSDFKKDMHAGANELLLSDHHQSISVESISQFTSISWTRLVQVRDWEVKGKGKGKRKRKRHQQHVEVIADLRPEATEG
ncbi:hypothetical protein Q7P37_009747 [Cladosporium fusiforme]